MLSATLLLVVACGKPSNNDSNNPSFGSSYVGPDCTGTNKVLKIAGTINNTAVTDQITLVSHEFIAGSQTEPDGVIIGSVAKDKPSITLTYPASEVSTDPAEATAQGTLNLTSGTSYSNCTETDAFPSTVYIDRAAGFIRFVLRTLRTSNGCTGAVVTGTIAGCFIDTTP